MGLHAFLGKRTLGMLICPWATWTSIRRPCRRRPPPVAKEKKEVNAAAVDVALDLVDVFAVEVPWDAQHVSQDGARVASPTGADLYITYVNVLC